MKLIDFTKQHIEQAAALALASYEEQRRLVPSLPTYEAVPDLTAFAENGLGVAALEGERLVGFLGSVSPFDRAFRSTQVRGVFSPMGAHGASLQDRARVYAALYQAAGAKWARAGAVSHALCLYSHDQETQQQFFRYGFGMRSVDAMRSMEPVACAPCSSYAFAELERADYPAVYPLDEALNHHCRKSPFFMNRSMESAQAFAAACKTRDVRYFVALQGGVYCAFLSITGTGETFAADGAQYRHINGAYCLPEHRGKGVYPNLLNHVVDVLRTEGVVRLGVDFESINPTAYGFWLKHFTPYTYGVVRRIDEDILTLSPPAVR